MSIPLFQISPLPKSISVQSNNFKNCINVGSSLDCALFIGIIEYHIKVNKVEEIKRIYEKAQAQSVGKIKTIISNSENQQQRLEYILKEFKQTTEFCKNLDQMMGNYFKNKGISNEKDKDKDLKNKVKILEQDFNIRFYLYDSKSNLKIQDIAATTIYIYRSDPNFYILINAQVNLIACSKCNGQSNLQKLKCNHMACFQCIQSQFEGKNISIVSFPCFVKNCQQKIEKSYYLQMKLPKSLDQKQYIKQGDNSSKQSPNQVEKKQESYDNCVKEKNQIYCMNTQQILTSSKSEETQFDKNMNQEKGDIQIQVSSKLEKQQKSQFEQTEQPIQHENLNTLENIQKNRQNQKQEEIKAQKQLHNKQCNHCFKECKEEIFEASCGHCYCPKCTQILTSKNKQYTCLHPKCNNIKKIDYKLETKCDQCQDIRDRKLLFTNFCDHQICVQCLEGLVKNKRNYKCPICFKNLQSKDIELFFENLQFQIYEQETEKNSLKQDQFDFQQQILQEPNNPKQCTFCLSPFTEFNLQQQLSHCKNPLHMIGVCCSIFPLDCPQCQIPSLEISKYQITFEIRKYFDQNTLY
ncbi:unnamed protein product [Paramecium primaurelia]|uniref:RING-type domain-containing protein n=1 Tax=Paramecium primaurelia TaxID=5886 RepID=A0A8S1QCF2_PARPR|nr:unnamed protein product [Paramecium primaurelia]